MQTTLLGYKLTDLLTLLEPYTARFKPSFLKSSSFSTQLDKFTVINTVISTEKASGQPLPNRMLVKVISAIIHEEPVVIPVIPEILTATFGISADSPQPLVLFEGNVYRDRVDFFIFSQLKLNLDLTNFSLLRKMRKTGPFTYEVDNSPFNFPVFDRALKLKIDSEGTFEFIDPDLSGEPAFHVENFPPVMIADTGFVLEFEKVAIQGSFDAPSLSAIRAFLVPPASMELPGNIPFPRIEAAAASITRNGLSGNFSAVWDLRFNEQAAAGSNPFSYRIQNTDHPATFFGTGDQAIKGGFSKVDFRFLNNQFVEGLAAGKMLIPYFDAPIDIELRFNKNGSCSIVLTSLSESGMILTKEQLMELHVKKLEFVRRSNGGFFFQVSGGLKPLLYASEGMKWPLLELDNFSIDSSGNIVFREAMLELDQPAALDMFGFHVELKKIGLGMLGDGDQQKLWLELGGGLKLIEQLPLGLDLEGFRLIWPRNLRFNGQPTAQNILEFANQFEIQFKGLQISYAIPGALQLDGMIRFIKEGQTTGFAGDMVLIIPPSGIRADAGLMVGMNKSQPNPFPFFYVYFGLESAAGIPLGTSGLALKGAMGLFGINVMPNRSEGQDWYHDWYKKAPGPGAHQTTKWSDQRNAMAVGAGLTITTADGVIKGTKGILVLAFPGPIVVINGQALIFQGLNPTAEPPFSVTAIFDGKEQIAQFNIEAQAEIVKDIISAEAGAELYFDFKDATKWHLYLGENRPVERRIQANILNIIEANAYLMLDMLDADSPRSRMGIQASSSLEMDPVVIEIPVVADVEIKFSASYSIYGDGTISVNPDHFSGDAGLQIEGELKVMAFSISFAAGVDVSVEGPSPFSLKGSLEIEADLPGPLPDFNTQYDFEFSIPKVNVTFEDPLQTVSLFNRFSSQSISTPIYAVNSRLPESFNSETKQNENYVIPYVECDSMPVLNFTKEMNTVRSDLFYMYPGGNKYFDLGAIKIKPILEKIIIREREKRAGASWSVLFSTEQADNKTLLGHWMVESDPASPGRPASRRLMLLNRNPFTGSAHATDTIGGILPGFPAAQKHLSAQLLDDFEDILCAPALPEKTCVFFRYPGKAIARNSFEWSGLQIVSDEKMTINNPCLSATDDIVITFPEKLLYVEIIFCDVDSKPVAEIVSTGKLKSKAIERPTLPKKGKISIRDIARIGQGADRMEGNKIVLRSTSSFDQIRIRPREKKGALRIQSICYASVAAQIDNQLNQQICNANKDLLREALQQQIFQPDRVYEIEVRSRLELTLVESRIDNPFIKQQYQEIVRQPPQLSSRFCYFQTGNPPQNLQPYIKWTKPGPGDLPVFCDQQIAIRFLRGYMNQLYNRGNLQLYLISSTQNEPILINNWEWLKAGSTSLFPDEETISSYLSRNSITSSTTFDDILQFDLKQIPGYSTDQQYEIVLTCPDSVVKISGNPIGKKRILSIGSGKRLVIHSFVFRTAKAPSIQKLVSGTSITNSFTSPTGSITARKISGNAASIPSNWAVQLDAWYESRKEVHTTAVDYSFGIASYLSNGKLLTGKEAMEKVKNLLRENADKVLKSFQQIAVAIESGEYFKKAPDILSVNYVNTGSGKVRYVWLRFPSPQEIKYKEFGCIDVELFINNTKYTLEKNAVFDTEGSQIIFDLGGELNEASISRGELKIHFDTGNKDDISDNSLFGNNQKVHHRYDRAGLKGNTKTTLTLNIIA